MAIPPASVLLRASQMAIDSDKPIYLDYYRGSLSKECFIVVQETSQCLWKSDDEYTSGIQSVAKCDGCFIIVTENSLYIVSADILIRKGVLPTQS